MIAPRHTARDLEVENAVPYAVAAYCLAKHDAERVARHRHGYAQFLERALQPVHVAALINEAPCPHLAHLVDAIGELVAAILDMHARVTMRHVASIHIGDA